LVHVCMMRFMPLGRVWLEVPVLCFF
jgi:hypothetical protein